MTGIKLVDAIVPSLPEGSIRTSMNKETWWKVIGNRLHIPPESVMRGNFILLDTLIESLHSWELRVNNPQDRSNGLWDDSKVQGVCYEFSTEQIKAISYLNNFSCLAVDIETRDVGYDGNKVLLIGFAYSDYNSIALQEPFSEEVIVALRKLFASETIKFIWQNGKFDTARLKYLLNIDARIDEDTMLQHYVGINERKGTHGLKDLGPLYLQTPQWDEELENFKRKWCYQNKVKVKDFKYDMIPMTILIPYLYRDTCSTYQLNKLFHKLMRPESVDIYYKLVKAANVFREVEYNGCLVDMNYIYELQDQLDSLIYEAEKHVKRTASQIWDPALYVMETGAKSFPKEFSHTSPKQLKWMLEQVTGERLSSTNKDTLDMLAEKYPEIPFIKAIMELRKYNKYMDTYVEGILKVVNKDNRVRCTFNLHGTETGRLSCSEPNMQNIPRMKMIKDLFIAPEGYKLVQFDYSQAELRVLAWLSQDEYLMETYREGKDLHDAMALKIFGPDFNKEQRVAAKTVNFGIPYGRGPGSMASKMHMTIAQASQTVRDWYKAAPGAKAFVDKMRKVPYNSEPYTTIFGRQRHYIITMDNKNHVENEAVNFPVSSVASDLTMLSVCRINDIIKEENLDARIVNTVHDSIILEVRDDESLLRHIVDIGRLVMSGMPKKYLTNPPLTFPFKADADIGQSWGGVISADEYFEQQNKSMESN